MIQLEILSGTKAGTNWVPRQFPFRVGRDKAAALSLADDGVWDAHFEVRLEPREGCFISGRAECLTLVNGQTVESSRRLRNGDIIEAGSVKLRFVLGATRQYTLAWREVLTWVAIGLLCGAQLALIYFVLP